MGSATPVAFWRSLLDEARSGALNMAIDHALARCAGEGVGVVRLYRWSRPTLSFGRNEIARGRFDIDEAARRGIDFVRRPTGGRVVLHADEVTYSVIVPARALGGPRATYRAVNEVLATAFRTLGAVVGVQQDGRPAPLDAGPCFGTPVEGEVVAAGRKLVGSAQARIGSTLLQHGSIILRGSQAVIGELAGESLDPSHEPATLEGLAGPVGHEAVETAILEAMRARWDGVWEESALDSVERREAERWVEERYGREEWTWRR